MSEGRMRGRSFFITEGWLQIEDELKMKREFFG
jgi:hypothetical protein